MPKRYEEIGTEVDRLFYDASHFTVRALGAAFFLFRVKGAEFVPQEGPAIIACNHLHKSDVVLAPAAVPKRHVTPIARRGVMNPLFQRWGALAIDRPDEGENMKPSQFKAMIDILKEGRLELLFTSGTRTPGEKPAMPKRGVALIARLAKVKTIPTIIKGSDRLSEQRVTVAFGEAIDHPTHPREDAEFLYDLMMRQRELFDNVPHSNHYIDPAPN